MMNTQQTLHGLRLFTVTAALSPGLTEQHLEEQHVCMHMQKLEQPA